jgi:glycine/D-amino acid oxidase-like deaminating enzyme
MIGAAGDFAPGVWLAVGHEGLGVTTSLASAKLLAAQIVASVAPIAVEPYLPERFARKVAHDS